jgi:Leucine-rich repeat (LRR) protein
MGLEALDMSKNGIASLPMLSAPALRELYLGGNGLERWDVESRCLF